MNNKKNDLIALKSGYYFDLFRADEVTMNVEEVGAVQLMGKQYPLYAGKEYVDAQAIDRLFGDSMGNLISEHRVIDEPDICDY